ncbi:MAG: hypothetical protein JNL90_14175 [Planctomycetes bacterium]|nr:hypothetical protein [Planctomycetota bacterium]
MSAGDSTTAAPARRLLTVAAAAFALLLLGFAIDARRAWTAWLLAFVQLTELALAGTFFLALLVVARARFAARLEPVLRAMGAALPLAFVLGLVLLLGVPTLYEWSHGAAHDELLARKAAWLNLPGFAARLVGCFAAWWLLGRRFEARATQGRAAAYVAVVALAWSVASIDWLQSLEPHWFSTLFALRTATGMVLSGLAAVVLLGLLGGAGDPLRAPGAEALRNDVGKLLLSFSILWAYVAYCQHMLIWYTDIPEEASYYARRSSGGWQVLTIASVLLGFVVPFLALLPRRARCSAAVLLRVSLALLAGVALDLYGMAGPPLAGAHPALGWIEIAGLTFAFASFFGLARARLVAGAAAAMHASPSAMVGSAVG